MPVRTLLLEALQREPAAFWTVAALERETSLKPETIRAFLAELVAGKDASMTTDGQHYTITGLQD